MMRLDLYLLKNGYVDSRNKAAELIKNFKVRVDSAIVTKPSFKIENSPKIDILEEKIYVSRAALKLKHFLDDSKIEISDKVCLDIGSSTGGFIEVLLDHGASEISAVDIGSGQLDKKLRNDHRVISVEKKDIREFKSDKKFDVVTCDVSFVGISHILSSIDNLANDKIIILFKPQFEVGKDVKRDKKGVVKDMDAVKRAYMKFESEAVAFGWEFIKKEDSKVKGKEGNAETFYCFRKR